MRCGWLAGERMPLVEFGLGGLAGGGVRGDRGRLAHGGIGGKHRVGGAVFGVEEEGTGGDAGIEFAAGGGIGRFWGEITEVFATLVFAAEENREMQSGGGADKTDFEILGMGGDGVVEQGKAAFGEVGFFPQGEGLPGFDEEQAAAVRADRRIGGGWGKFVEEIGALG